LSNEELTITDGPSMPMVDSIEVYGRAENVLGWKEKMNAVLHIACDMGSNAGAKSLKRPQTMKIGCYLHGCCIQGTYNLKACWKPSFKVTGRLFYILVHAVPFRLCF
jgi:hypothetical protein